MTSTSTSSIDIRASAERVWFALTNAEQVPQWQYGSQLLTDWSVGGPIRFVSRWEGQVFEQWGTVLEFRPLESLSYTLFAPRPGLADLPENYFVMTYALEQLGDRTRVSITQEDPRPVLDDETEADDEFDPEEVEDIEDTASDGESPVMLALRELCEE